MFLATSSSINVSSLAAAVVEFEAVVAEVIMALAADGTMVVKLAVDDEEKLVDAAVEFMMTVTVMFSFRLS